jgi:hypothetical protein
VLRPTSVLRGLGDSLLHRARSQPKQTIGDECCGQVVMAVQRHLNRLGFICGSEWLVAHLVQLVIHDRLQALRLL